MKSTLFLTLGVFLSLFAIVSCQKVFSDGFFDSAGTLKDSAGNCLSSAVAGVYQKDSALTASNYIDVQINVTEPGDYSIKSNIVNGFSFKGEGTLTLKGLQSVRLTGIGTPLTEGIFTFTITYNSSSCDIDVAVMGANTSEYTLTDTLGNCIGVITKGVYMQNIPLDTSNYLEADVHVTKVGTYTLSVAPINGIAFTSVGSFTDTGIQHVILQGAGTPSAAGDFDATISNGTSACNFTITMVAENNNPAAYTINCASVQLNGTYSSGVPMDATNTATISVTVNTPGKYNISTTSVNGISFSASGTFTVASSRDIILVATGTPAAKGDFDFPVNGNGSTCSFKVGFTGAAEFTLAGAPNACTNATVNGTYTEGVALNNTNTVVVKVNVTAIGPYTFTTNTVNGITFSSTGTFTNTGEQDITLIGYGTPAAKGVSTLTPQIGSSSCTFDITVEEQQTDPAIFTCKIDGVFTAFNDRAQASNEDLFGELTLILDGYTGPPNGGNVPELQFFIHNADNSPVAAGTYDIDHFLQYNIEIDYLEVGADQDAVRWNTSSSFLSPNPPFTIKITSITGTRIKGTFSGKVTDLGLGGTRTKTITEGVFDLPLK